MDTQEVITPTVEKKDKGFTLVELLIVIVILGVLATVTVFAVRGITDRGTTSACQADKATLSVAVEAYFAQNAGATITGTDPEATLVTAGLLRGPSSKYNVAADGSLTVQDTACTGA